MHYHVVYVIVGTLNSLQFGGGVDDSSIEYQPYLCIADYCGGCVGNANNLFIIIIILDFSINSQQKNIRPNHSFLFLIYRMMDISCIDQK